LMVLKLETLTLVDEYWHWKPPLYCPFVGAVPCQHQSIPIPCEFLAWAVVDSRGTSLVPSVYNSGNW
jgi:hypothetical protein